MVFVRRLGGAVVSLDIAHDATLGELATAICDIDGLAPEQQVLLLNNKPLSGSSIAFLRDSAGFSALSTITVLARLRGGKGGFGARLRSMAGKVGAKKTTNFSACRDLSGRRLRHVEAERALRDWVASDARADPAEVAEKFAAIKRGAPAGKDKDVRARGGKAAAAQRARAEQQEEEEARERERVSGLKDLGRRFGSDTGQAQLDDVGSASKAVVGGAVAEGLKAALLSAGAGLPTAAAKAAAVAAAGARPAAAVSLSAKGGMFGLGLDLGSDSDDDSDGDAASAQPA